MKRILLLVFISLWCVSSIHAEEKIGLSVGEMAPDFTALTHAGKEARLSDALSQGPVVLVFYRGGWCYYCNLQLQELQMNLGKIQKQGAHLIAISVDLQENAAQTVEEKMLDFTVISNPEADLLKAFNVVYHVPKELAEKYKNEYDIDLEAASGRKDRLISVPAVYVIDPSGRVTYAHVDTNYKIRPPLNKILETLEHLNQKQDLKEHTIEMSLCSDQALGVVFYCNGDWGLETSENTLFIIVKEEDPSLTITITKSEAPVISMKQLTPAVLKELGNYDQDFSTTMVKVDQKDAIRIDGVAEGFPETQLRDYYIIHNLELYAVLFAFSPKDQWGEYESLSTMIMNSFRFSDTNIPAAAMSNDGV